MFEGHKEQLTLTQLARDHDSREKSAPLALSRRAAHKIDSTDLASLPELIHRREQKQTNEKKGTSEKIEPLLYALLIGNHVDGLSIEFINCREEIFARIETFCSFI